MPPKRPSEEVSTELFVEIGVEEIPSNVMREALNRLGNSAAERLAAAAIVSERPKVYGTPRRLILHIPHVAPSQETKTETAMGPSKKVAFDPNGNPTPAALGFAKSQGVAVAELGVKQTEKGEYLSVEKKIEGRPTAQLLEKIIPEVIASLTFPRSMRWNEEGVSFVRPIRWIVALYGGKTVPFSYAGVAAGNVSSGHRIMAPAPFTVSDFTSYREEIGRRFVLIDPEERYAIIQKEMEALAEGKKGRLEKDENLVWQAAFMVEYPKAILGSFDPSFLEVPKEVITTAMKEHQGYFPLYAEAGGLLPHFITIINTPTDDTEIIRKGNERVLRARLVDAKFYFEQDRKSSLGGRVEALQGVTFQAKLGTVFEKTQRLIGFSSWEGWRAVGSTEGLERAALLCKCDLVSGVVREFPSLQGIMGRIYATLDGEPASAAEAIEAHYLPRFSGGPLPNTLTGQILAVIDKLDTIVGCFGVGLIPSGSEDPYALRRQGLGVIQIFLEEGPLRKVSLAAAIQFSIQKYEEQNKKPSGETLSQVAGFMKQRLSFHLQSEGIRYDLIEAVLAIEMERPFDVVERARALVEFSKQPLFSPLMTSFKRAIRILPKGFEGAVNEGLLKEVAEKELHAAVSSTGEKIESDWPLRRYQKILETLATLHEPLNRFFEGVMVMDPDPEIQKNRLSLLVWIKKLFNEFGNFSRIVEGEPTSKANPS